MHRASTKVKNLARVLNREARPFSKECRKRKGISVSLKIERSPYGSLAVLGEYTLQTARGNER
jgi:hypothetical protein